MPRHDRYGDGVLVDAVLLIGAQQGEESEHPSDDVDSASEEARATPGMSDDVPRRRRLDLSPQWLLVALAYALAGVALVCAMHELYFGNVLLDARCDADTAGKVAAQIRRIVEVCDVQVSAAGAYLVAQRA